MSMVLFNSRILHFYIYTYVCMALACKKLRKWSRPTGSWGGGVSIYIHIYYHIIQGFFCWHLIIQGRTKRSKVVGGYCKALGEWTYPQLFGTCSEQIILLQSHAAPRISASWQHLPLVTRGSPVLSWVKFFQRFLLPTNSGKKHLKHP